MDDPCLDENAWDDLLDGRLAAEDRSRVEAHIDRCSACRRVLATLLPALTRDSEGPPPSASEPGDAAATPSRIGRYVIVEEIARGGMGRVLRGWDPELRREVAIKLLTTHGTHASERIAHEARALARLAHPNVLPVYDTAEDHGVPFIAMELVDGPTLRQWCEREPPSWTDIVRTFADAGTGLAAAHAAGIVHGDFKPDNVLLAAKDRRVLVADFGLARTRDAAPLNAELSRTDEGNATPTTDPSRASGSAVAVIGTPAYLAPEQHAGRPADAQSDQYAFCVSLYEALAGRRPFTAGSLAALAVAKERTPVPLEGAVPRWLWHAVRRGLAHDAALRWPSMDALVAELRRDRRRRIAPVLAAGAIAGAAIVAVLASSRPRACSEAEQLWGEPQRAAIASALLGTALVHAPHTNAAVQSRLASYAERWSAAHAEACATEQATLLDARMRCLHERRQAFSAVVTTLADADVDVLNHAVATVEALPEIDRCADADYVLAQVAPPEDAETAAAVERAREALAHVAALGSAGRYAIALERAEAVTLTADALGYPPLRAEAGFARGWLLVQVAEDRRGAEVLREAYFDAKKSGSDELAANSASFVAFVLGSRLGRLDEARTWAGHAQSDIERLDNERMRASWSSNLAAIRYAEGEYDEAMRLSKDAVAILERARGAEHLDVAVALNGLGTAQYERGLLDEAAQSFTRALAILQTTLGPDHPDAGGMTSNLGAVAYARGDYGTAIELHARALAIAEAALPPDHPDVANGLTNLGNAQDAAGAHEDAARSHARALAIVERLRGGDSPDVAVVLSNLGNVELAAGQIESAERRYRRAVEILAQTPNHPDLAMVLGNLARSRQERGALDEAEALYLRALAAREALLGKEHPDLAYPLLGLGEIAIARGRRADAIAALERALAVRKDGAGDPAMTADIEAALARAQQLR
ncbi:MAG TPA: tetratricopeptide repeat protein [Nannocystaceae bacterium]|nr:tetratricopeptide repeat protein [Nannocystaceae bacterium]